LKDLYVYVEGGGDRKDSKRACRLGFSDLFSAFTKKAQLSRVSLRFVSCGSRNEAFDKFCTAVTLPSSGERTNLLLVDQKDELPARQPNEKNYLWRHVHERDGWTRPAQVKDDHLHFMTMAVEAWIASDAEALRRHYGDCLKASQLPRRALETVARTELVSNLESATAGCPPLRKATRVRHNGQARLDSCSPTSKLREVLHDVRPHHRQLESVIE